MNHSTARATTRTSGSDEPTGASSHAIPFPLAHDYPSETLREWVSEQDEQKRAFFDLVSEGVNVRTPEEIAAVFEGPVEDYGETVDASDALGEAIYVQKQP